MAISKRVAAARAKIDRNKLYPVAEALNLVKETATDKFDESVDAVINLGIDARKSDQLVRGALVLPHGTGKTKRVAVFAQGAQAEAAKAAKKKQRSNVPDPITPVNEGRDARSSTVLPSNPTKSREDMENFVRIRNEQTAARRKANGGFCLLYTSPSPRD